MINKQIAWEIGNDLAKNTIGANRYLAPLSRLHTLLGCAIPSYLHKDPDQQADLIAEAQTGWQDFFTKERIDD